MRSWLAIPIGGACAAATLIAIAGVPVAIAGGLAAAAMIAAVRALLGDAPAAIAGACAAAALALATLVDLHAASPRELVAVAAFAWTIAELAKAHQPTSSPLVALLPAAIAGVLDIAFIPLLPIAAVRLVTAPWARPRWVVAVPIVTTLVALVGAAMLVFGVRPELAAVWASHHAPTAAAPPPPSSTLALAAFATSLAEALGPVLAVAALAGIAALPSRSRNIQIALAATCALALVAAFRAHAPVAPLVGLAALLAGLAIARLAGMIRLATGQAIAGATLGLVSLAPPVLAIALAPR